MGGVAGEPTDVRLDDTANGGSPAWLQRGDG